MGTRRYGRTRAAALSTAALVLAAGATASSALAQASSGSGPSTPGPEAPSSAAAPATPADGKTQLQAIVVTAERREQNLQTVPMAVAAFTPSQVSASGVTDPMTLSNLVPGLNFDRQGPSSTPFIRGVGNPVGQVGDEPSVAFYVDDVYYSSPSGSVAGFNDISHLEVEKGPQGTLFGRNATGGVVQVFTKDPTTTPTADISAGYANYNTPSGSLYASAGLLPGLSGNIALYGSDQQDGWGKDLATGQDVYLTTQWGGRAKLLWKPTPSTTVLFSADYDRTSSDVGTDLRPVPGTESGVPGTPGFGLPGPKNFYDTNEDLTGPGIVTQGGGSVKIVQNLGWAKLTSITAARSTSSHFPVDEDISPYPLVFIYAAFNDREITQEFRLGSDQLLRLKWTLGFFYFNDYAGEEPLVVNGPITAPLPDGFVSYGIQTTNSYAGFGEATATLLPDTHLTFGARYTVDERGFSAHYALPGVFPGFATSPGSPQEVTYSKPTFRVALDHQFTREILAYLAYNTGFKSGFYNTAVFPVAPVPPPVKPEDLTSYTAGFKTEWLDRRLRFNVEGFYYDYSNIQVEQIVQGTTQFSNAAAATIKGVDVDLQAIPVENLTVAFSAEGLDGHYTDYPDGTLNMYVPGEGINKLGGYDLAGNQTIQSPPFTFSASANYLIPTTRVGTFALDGSVSRIGDFYWEPDNGEGQLSKSVDRQPLVYLVNLSVDWTSPTKKYDVLLYGRNVTGEKYYSQEASFPFAAAGSAAAPATFGVKGTVHFGG